jgi:hypothetical protein
MSKLIWISVGGNDCEPARLEDGKVYTIGCADPLPPDKFKIVSEKFVGQPARPRTTNEQREFDVWLEKEKKAGRVHGYRRFTEQP